MTQYQIKITYPGDTVPSWDNPLPRRTDFSTPHQIVDYPTKEKAEETVRLINSSPTGVFAIALFTPSESEEKNRSITQSDLDTMYQKCELDEAEYKNQVTKKHNKSIDEFTEDEYIQVSEEINRIWRPYDELNSKHSKQQLTVSVTNYL